MRKTFSIERATAYLANLQALEAERAKVAPTHWGMVDTHRACEIVTLTKIAKLHAVGRMNPTLQAECATQIRASIKRLQLPSMVYAR